MGKWKNLFKNGILKNLWVFLTKFTEKLLHYQFDALLDPKKKNYFKVVSRRRFGEPSSISNTLIVLSDPDNKLFYANVDHADVVCLYLNGWNKEGDVKE